MQIIIYEKLWFIEDTVATIAEQKRYLQFSTIISYVTLVGVSRATGQHMCSYSLSTLLYMKLESESKN